MTSYDIDLYTYVHMYVCMMLMKYLLPDPLGLRPFHIRDYIPDFIVFIYNLVQPQNNLVQPQTALLQGCFSHATVSYTYLPQCTYYNVVTWLSQCNNKVVNKIVTTLYELVFLYGFTNSNALQLHIT